MKNIFLSLFFIASCFQVATASSILQIDTNHLVNNASSVFEAEVVSSRSEIDKNDNIYTYVDFLILDNISGDLAPDQLEPGSIITLRFTGGKVGNLQLDVGSTIPVVGERGIYFVESTNKKLINPFLGWQQGQFRIRTDGTIIAGNDEVVLGVENNTSNSSPLKTNRSFAISHGVAKGIITRSTLEENQNFVERPQVTSQKIFQQKPLTVDEFKTYLKGLKGN